MGRLLPFSIYVSTSVDRFCYLKIETKNLKKIRIFLTFFKQMSENDIG